MPSIEPFIHRKVVVLHQETPVHQAARAMCERSIGCLVVGDHGGHIVGIVTDRDLACGPLAQNMENDVPLSEIMSSDPITVGEDADLSEVISLMEEHGIRRVPVVQTTAGYRQKCVGIVTLDDLIASHLVDYDSMVKIVRRQISSFSGNGHSQELALFRAHERAEARAEQTLNLFYKSIGTKSGLKGEQKVKAIRAILECLIKRLHYTGAAHLVSQLPRKLQDDLLSLRAGPDRSVTVEKVIEEVSRAIGVTEEQAKPYVFRIFSALGSLIQPGQLGHIKAQLPEEMRVLFEDELKAKKGGPAGISAA